MLNAGDGYKKRGLCTQHRPQVNVLLNWPVRSLSENSVVGPRASVFSSAKDGEAGDVGFIVDARVQSGGQQAARSQIEFSNRFLSYIGRISIGIRQLWA